MNNRTTSHEHHLSLEVFSPSKNCSRKIPDPPVDLIVSSHAVVDGKLFLSGTAYRGGCLVVVCLDLVNGYKWVEDFVQGFLRHHEFYGEGHLLGDTLYALSGINGAVPAAYNLNPERVRRNLSECSAMNEELDILDRYASELFGDRALLTPSLEAVHEHVFYRWLDSRLLHIGDGTFCYLSTGSFPHESSPEYFGVNLTLFKPSEQTFTETICDFENKSFGGDFISFTHLELSYTHSRRDIGSLQGCFSVPSDGAGRGLTAETLSNVKAVPKLCMFSDYPAEIPYELTVAFRRRLKSASSGSKKAARKKRLPGDDGSSSKGVDKKIF